MTTDVLVVMAVGAVCVLALLAVLFVRAENLARGIRARASARAEIWWLFAWIARENAAYSRRSLLRPDRPGVAMLRVVDGALAWPLEADRERWS